MAKTVADYQRDATNRYNELLAGVGGDPSRLPPNIWTTDPKLVAAHEGVVAAKEGTGAAYDSSTGKWSDQDYGDSGSKSSSSKNTSSKSRSDYQREAEADAASAINMAFGDQELYEMMSDEELADYAAQLAQTRYDAAIQALRGNEGTLRSDYEGAIGELDAMYGQRKANAETLMEQAGIRARDEAIARGGQRGGLETYIENNLNKQIMGNLNQAENEFMAKKNTLRGAFDTSVKNNLAAINQALADKAAYQTSVMSDTRLTEKDKAAYYANMNQQTMLPYLMETANQKRTSDIGEAQTYGFNATGQDYGSVASNNNLSAAIAALQKQAGDHYSGLSAAEKEDPNVWTKNPTLSGLHTQVAQLQGNNATYDPTSGKWTTLNNLLSSYGI